PPVTSMSAGSVLAGIIAMVAAAVPIAPSRQPPQFPTQTSPEDPVALLRSARASQHAFKRPRRRRRPETWPSAGGSCDGRVGRFCLPFGGGHDGWEPPPEDEEVVAARDKLIEGLGGADALIPGDGWIAGQRVRYLVEARRF